MPRRHGVWESEGNPQSTELLQKRTQEQRVKLKYLALKQYDDYQKSIEFEWNQLRWDKWSPPKEWSTISYFLVSLQCSYLCSRCFAFFSFSFPFRWVILLQCPLSKRILRFKVCIPLFLLLYSSTEQASKQIGKSATRIARIDLIFRCYGGVGRQQKSKTCERVFLINKTPTFKI